jgi:lipopolysaccharide/colanic/teichoic acid biosynthesis glycosyltransferase
MGESLVKSSAKPFSPDIFVRVAETIQKNRPNDFGRRLLDILAAGLGLLFLAPVFLLISIAIRRESSGPVFYRGKRAGKNGRPFGILKFRTMYERPESYTGPRVTAQDDSRITPLGNWLRHTKLNELPQLWNVLKGEMSLVGPRPEDYDIAMEWPDSLRQEVLSVCPGITSPASVVYRNEESLLSQDGLMDDYLNQVLPSKLRLDLLYIRHRTIFSDLDVIFWTFVMLLPRIGKVEIPESLLLWGPLSHFFSRYANWFFIDSLVAFVAVGLSEVLWRISEPLNLGWEVALLVGIATTFAFSLCNMVLGLQNISWEHAPAQESIKLAFSTSVAVITVIVLDRIISPRDLPSQLMVLAGVLTYGGFIVVRYRERLLTGLASRWIRYREGAQILGERVLIVGAGDNGSLAAWLLRRKDFSRFYSIIGFVDDDPRKYALQIEGYPVRGSTRDIPQLVKQLDIGLIVYTIEQIAPPEQQRILEICHQTSARIVMLPEMIRFLRVQLGIQNKSEDLSTSEQLPSSSPTISAGQAFLWIEAIESVTKTRDWEGLEAQLRHVRSELDHITDISSQ